MSKKHLKPSPSLKMRVIIKPSFQVPTVQRYVSGWMMPSPYMEAGTFGNQKLISVANIVEDFENPVMKDENLSDKSRIRFLFIG